MTPIRQSVSPDPADRGQNAGGEHVRPLRLPEEADDREGADELHRDNADGAETDRPRSDAEIGRDPREPKADHDQRLDRRHEEAGGGWRPIVRMDLRQMRGQEAVGREGEHVFARGVVEREIGRQQAGDEEKAGDGRQQIAAILRRQVEQEVAALLFGEGLHVIGACGANHDPDSDEVEYRDREKRREGCDGNGALGPARFFAVERRCFDADEGGDGERHDRAEIPAHVVLRPPDLHRKGGPTFCREHRDVESGEDQEFRGHEEGERAGREIEREIAHDPDDREARDRAGHPRNFEAELVEQDRAEIAEGRCEPDRHGRVSEHSAIGGDDAGGLA